MLIGLIGPPIERLLRFVYDRDESFQLLLTFALVLMFQDVFRFIWGANPRSLDSGYLIYGKITSRRLQRAGLQSAGDRWRRSRRRSGSACSCSGTNYGRILRATAENRGMAEALGVDVRRVYSVVFTVGAMLGTMAGALVVPTVGGLARHGDRIRHRGLRRGGDRRARLDARRARRRADRRADPRARDRLLSRSSRCSRST